MELNDIKVRLESEIFVGFGKGNEEESVGKDKYPEKLLQIGIITEEKRSKDKPGFFRDNSSDEEEEKDPRKKKTRIICLTVKKNSKIKIYKVKMDKNGIFTVTKNWNLDDIKSVESLDDNGIVVVLGMKTHKWTFRDYQKKTEFLFMASKLCKKYLKKQPKLINIDEDDIKSQLKYQDSFLSTAEKDIVGGFDDAKKDQRENIMDLANLDAAPLENLDSKTPAIKDAVIDFDLENMLMDFSWQVDEGAAHLEQKLLSELQTLESENLNAIISSEAGADALVQQIESAIKELDVIEDWLAHYTEILDSMGADVHQVELRNKNLQTASHNQKVLLTHVEDLLGKLKIPGYIIEVLLNEPLEYSDGIQQCEEACDKLMEFLQTKHEDGLSNLNMVKERQKTFQKHGDAFSERLGHFLRDLLEKQTKAYLLDTSRSCLGKSSLKLFGHEKMEEKLFKFRKLLRWLKEFDPRRHTEIQMTYIKEAGFVYEKEITEFFEQLKNNFIAKRTPTEEIPYSFVVVSTSVTSAASNAIKSAVANKSAVIMPKRKKSGQSSHVKALIAADDRSDMSQSKGGVHASVLTLELGPDEKMMPDAAVGHSLSMILPFIVREHNLIRDIFSFDGNAINSKEKGLVVPQESTLQLEEWLEKMNQAQEPLKEAKLQKKLNDLLDMLFNSVKVQLYSLMIEASQRMDGSYALGMLVEAENCKADYETSGNVYVMALLDEVFKVASGRFEQFIEDQVQVLEEIKFSLKKKNGILPTFSTFPKLMDHFESFMNPKAIKARASLTLGYEKIIRALFVGLEVTSKEAATVVNQSDDKESVNMNILNIENMHFFHSELRARKIPGLDPFVKQAKAIYDANLVAYCRVVVRKPLGKLLFFEGVEDLLKTQAPEEVSFHLMYSKAALKEVIRRHTEKEGLESLHKRVQKHFTDDEAAGQLVLVVWRGIQEELVNHLRNFENLISLCYPEANLKLECSVEEMLAYFSELAKSQ